MARSTASAFLDPGERDRLIILQTVTEGVDTEGAPMETSTTLAVVWASKAGISGQERWVRDQLSAGYDTRWQIGYRADMDPELVDVAKVRQIEYQGRTYDIVAATQLGRRDSIELLTTEKVG